jgi:hypothetical protein
MVHCDERVATLNDAQVEHWTKGTMATRQDYSDTLPASVQQTSPLGYATYAISDLNTNSRTAGLSNQVRVSLAPTLHAPAGVRAKATSEGVLLSWTDSGQRPENPALHYLYRVFRRTVGDEKSPEVIAGEIPVTGDPTSSFVDRNIQWEKTYIYRVAGITQVQQPGKEAIEVEGDDSPPVEAFSHDVFPPATPSGLQAVFSGIGQKPFIDLTWAPNLESDLAGYNVFRHEEGGALTKVNKDLVQTPSFRDATVEAGHEYFYSVSAVDQRGNESGESEETSEKVPQ